MRESTDCWERATMCLNVNATHSNVGDSKKIHMEEIKETFSVMNESTDTKRSEAPNNESTDIFYSCEDLSVIPEAQSIEPKGTRKLENNKNGNDNAREEQGNESSESHNLSRISNKGEPSEDHEYNLDNLNKSQVDLVENLHASQVEVVVNFDGGQIESEESSNESQLVAESNSCDDQLISIYGPKDGQVKTVDIKDGCQIKAEHVPTSSQDEEENVTNLASSSQDEEEVVVKSRDHRNEEQFSKIIKDIENHSSEDSSS